MRARVEKVTVLGWNKSGGRLVASLRTRLIVWTESGSMEFLCRIVLMGSVGGNLVKG